MSECNRCEEGHEAEVCGDCFDKAKELGIGLLRMRNETVAKQDRACAALLEVEHALYQTNTPMAVQKEVEVILLHAFGDIGGWEVMAAHGRLKSVQRQCPNFSEWRNTKTGEYKYTCTQYDWAVEDCTPKCAERFTR